MGAQPVQDWQSCIASALEWWRDAGVDTLVDELPRDWLAPPPSRAAAEAGSAAVAAAPAPVAETLPETLSDFVAWRTSPAAPEAGWMAPLIPACGPADAEWAILTDFPEAADSSALMTGPEGRLLDAMLAAVGLSRESVYLASLAVARPIAGRVPPEQAPRLSALLRHHLTLLRPRKLLLLGQAAAHALPETAGPASAKRIQDVHLFGGTTTVVTTYHPRFLLDRPATKSEVWKHLLLLRRGSNQ